MNIVWYRRIWFITLSLLLVVGLICILSSECDLHMEGDHLRVHTRPHGIGITSLDQTDQKSFSSLSEKNVYDGYTYVLSTYYFNASSGFYKHRQAPSTEWLVVFISSLRAVARKRVADSAVPPSLRSTKLVFFTDALTFSVLWRDVHIIRTWSNEGFLHWIIVCPPDGNTTASGVAIPGDVPADVAQIWSPEFLNEKWASGVRNGANNFRFALYYKWLQQYLRFHEYSSHGDLHMASESSRFVICDSSDVAFQRDPFLPGGGCFPQEPDPYVVFTLESRKKNFRNEKYNRRWMLCYGEGVLKLIGKGEIACAGVILGNGMGMLRYLASLLQEIQDPHLVECSLSLEAALDQANHNYLLHVKHDYPSYKKIKSSHESSYCAFHGNYGKAVLNVENSVVAPGTNFSYAIVHQYTADRHPLVMKQMKKLYGVPH
ncbi:hypothetical protein DQ04_06491030 [Trypanosoma grayi]|uniref:hypothetical protein n=1 Tax=Trypanosoma grayi TaxID=71804 RepID=UPI0004F45ECC|nr:hypothetical protein DQ04_06491030 [Trypanosoma grayi]KEG08762.1 hypothetical protein DQ04_06491030 [Trypanosoma grayi]